jgi:hypothetical protein
MPTGGIKYIPVGLLRKERRRPVSTNAGRQHLENPLLLYVMQLALRNMEPLHFTKLYYMWHCRQDSRRVQPFEPCQDRVLIFALTTDFHKVAEDHRNIAKDGLAIS